MRRDGEREVLESAQFEGVCLRTDLCAATRGNPDHKHALGDLRESKKVIQSFWVGSHGKMYLGLS